MRLLGGIEGRVLSLCLSRRLSGFRLRTRFDLVL